MIVSPARPSMPRIMPPIVDGDQRHLILLVHRVAGASSDIFIANIAWPVVGRETVKRVRYLSSHNSRDLAVATTSRR